MDKNTYLERLHTLHAQIQEICDNFRQIRGEAQGILHSSEMPDSKQQLDDVLQSTEAATMTIIEATGAIDAAVQESAADAATKTAVTDLSGRIYEACSFQDISGQRIKKVMNRIGALEEKLLRLSDSARRQDEQASPALVGDPLMNGPQLSAQTPSQETVDALFATGGKTQASS